MSNAPKMFQEMLDVLAADAEQRWGETSLFAFCECPACGHSVVVLAAELVDKKLACPVCERDARQMVAMRSRPALDSDVPKRGDARRHDMQRFTCAGCGRECLSSWSEEEAAAEFQRLYGHPYDPAKNPPICDDCHKAKLARR